MAGDRRDGGTGEPDGVRPLPENFDLSVRDTAYFLWEQAGRPEGRAEDFWYQALHQHFRARAYEIWIAEGRPEGQALSHWQAAQDKG